MWYYRQSTGELQRTITDGNCLTVEHVGFGYSGNGDGKNCCAWESVHNHGPIPQGIYTISPAFTHIAKGVLSMNLIPAKQTNTFGRSGFMIHGDSREDPGNASHGCIVLNRPLRQQLANSNDRVLTVVA